MHDIKKLKNNAEHFARRASGRDILKNADGKTHYTEIAAKLGVHPTAVSGALKEAEQLGLATKTLQGFYKKNSGVMQYIPTNKHSKTDDGVTVDTIIKKVSTGQRGKKKLSKPKNSKVSARVANSAGKMVTAYHHLYFTENTLRELIRRVFKTTPSWWNSKVPKDVKDSVSDQLAKMPYHAASRRDELEYTHLGDLKKIVVKNWGMFEPHMHEKDKTKFNAAVDKAIPSRNAIGHCIPLNKDDSRWLELRFQDVLQMIK